MSNLFIDLLLIYGFLTLSHLGLQMVLAHIEYVKRKKIPSILDRLDLAIIVPVYNENATILDKCLDSCIRADYVNGNKQIIIIDDGSKNISELNKIYSKYSVLQNVVIHKTENKGKRFAQKLGFDSTKADIIVTIDSDTVIAQNGLNEIVKPFTTSKVGAVTGHVMVTNKNTNLLTKLIGYRYWTAFNQERAAQSRFGVVMCCSGPFSAYRGSLIQKLKEKYVSQRFLGNVCTYGDDRHLTNLVLETGSEVYYCRFAECYTEVPENMKQYIKQQLRWNKSFYREMLWTIKAIDHHHFYMIYDMVMQFILPFLLMASLTLAVIRSIGNPEIMVRYILIVAGIGFLRSLYGIFRTRDLGFLLFLVYGFVHVIVLIPVRLYALTHMKDNSWSTR